MTIMDAVARPSSNVRMAFVMTPLVATTMWFVATLSARAIDEGVVHRNEALTLAVGGIIIGLPVAVLATLVFAVPVYKLLRHLDGISLVTTVVAGAVIGFLMATVTFIVLNDDGNILTPVRGVLIGVVSALVWWYKVAPLPRP